MALTFMICLPTALKSQFAGRSFEERRNAYIDDQGKYWQPWFPAAMKQAVFAWLEKPELPGNLQKISEEIYYLTTGTGRNGDRTCEGEFWWPWKNCWWTGDQPAPILASRIYYYYQEKKVISDADAQRIRNRLRQDIVTTPGIWCAVPNYQIRYLAVAYLYVTKIEDIGNVQFPESDSYGCPKSFSYQGRTYVNGRSYPARQIYEDYLQMILDQWLERGTTEDNTTSDYYYAQIHSMALLYDFAPSQHIRNKARMFLDWLILNYAIGFSANHAAGGHGRNYTALELSGKDFFPWGLFFNLETSVLNRITQPGTYTDLFVSRYRLPQFLVQLFEDLNGPGATPPDNYYRIIRGHIPALGRPWWHEGTLNTGYRYDYITPNYNLGGTGLGTGWELNIKADTVPFKIWMNHCEAINQEGCNTQPGKGELHFLGTHGYQDRNAIFVAGSVRLHFALGGERWDETIQVANWMFYRKNKVAVAVQIGARSAALEVVTLGVQYANLNDFINAVVSNARLTEGKFTTSDGRTIHKGYVDMGKENHALPFDRLEVWEGNVGQNNEKQIISWQNKILTIYYKNKKQIYDFNRWITTIAEPGHAEDSVAPASPSNVNVKVGS